MEEQIEQIVPDQQQMLLVGLNDPNINNDIDKEWSNRRAQQRPKTALHDRRQQQLQQLKSQYIPSQQNTNQKEPIKQEKPSTQVFTQNKELAAQFVVALEKFSENLTRDSGVALSYNMIEKNKDQQSIQTMIECIHASSKKNINPKTNAQNSIAIDMELITLAEIIKQNDSQFNNYFIEKIILIIKKHINCSSDTTIQAIAQVLIQLLEKINISQIYSYLSDCLYDKSKQIQFVDVFSYICYHLKQQNKIDEFNILGQLIYEIYQKLLLDSLEFLKCIEFLLLNNFNMNNEIIITRALKYCQVPINKNSKYYLIVCQACKIIQHMGTRTRSMSKEVITEMEKLTNDRRVDVQMAAKNAILVWKQQEIKQIEPNFEQFYNKLAFIQTPYTEYQKRGFQSFLRASSYVRKNSRSPSLPKLQPTVQPKIIREKIKKIRSNSPKFQMLQEDTEEDRRNSALKLLKEKMNDKKQNQDDEEIFEDSLEIDQFKKPKFQQQPVIQQNPITEQEEFQLQDSLVQPQSQSVKQLNKMPSIQYIDNLQTIKKSLHESKHEEENQQIDDQNLQIVDQNQKIEVLNQFNKENSIQKNELKTEVVQQTIIEQQQVIQKNEQFVQDDQENKYQKVQQEIQKVRAGNQIQQNEEQEIEIEDDEDVQQNLNVLDKPFQIKEIQNFEASIQEIPKEYISKNNQIDYQQELLNNSKEQIQIAQVIEMDVDQYKKQAEEIKVKSGQEEKQEIIELDQSIEEQDQISQNQQQLVDNKQIEQISKVEQSIQIPSVDQLQLIQNEQKQKQISKQSDSIKNNQQNENREYKKQENIKSKDNSLQTIQDDLQQKNNNLEKKQIKYKFNRQIFEQAICKGRQNINDGYQILFDNCDDLQKIQFMMMMGPQIGKLNNKTMNKILEFMNRIKESELLKILGLSLYKQVKECNYFDEINKEDLQNIKEILYDISGSEQEHIGLQAVNLYNEL